MLRVMEKKLSDCYVEMMLSLWLLGLLFHIPS